MLLVVVGNIDRPHIDASCARPSRSCRVATTSGRRPAVRRAGARAGDRNRALPTNYVLGYVPGPAATPDYVALRVATAVLSGRLFTEVRSRRNLSYDVEAQFLERANAVGGLYVTTVDPNAVLRIMRRELSTLQNEPVDPEGSSASTQQFITEYYMKNETNADQANVLARAEVFTGDYREVDRFMDDCDASRRRCAARRAAVPEGFPLRVRRRRVEAGSVTDGPVLRSWPPQRRGAPTRDERTPRTSGCAAVARSATSA